MSEKPPEKSPGGTPVSNYPVEETKPSPKGTPVGSMIDEVAGGSSPRTHPVPGRVKSTKIKRKERKKPIKPKKPVKQISNKISASMMSWNEATTIDLCLRSLANFVDEVCIVDTGSFDGTPMIAREWMDELNLSGEVIKMTVKNLVNARIKAFEGCKGPWVLLLDSNLVLSNALKSEIKQHTKLNPNCQLAFKSMNLMGDYEHYFSALPFHAPHRIFVRNDMEWVHNQDRQYFKMPIVEAKCWAVNLSRVRPAWRSWYRGEPFDRRVYATMGTKPGAVAHMNELNHQYLWLKESKYTSLVDYIEATKELTLEDVKKIAPEWYLNYLNKEATPIMRAMQKGLPEVIKEEQKNPRYKLIYEGDKITGRWPEL